MTLGTLYWRCHSFNHFVMFDLQVHGKRYAYRFDFAGLAQVVQQATNPTATATSVSTPVPDCSLQLHYCSMRTPVACSTGDLCLPCCYRASQHYHPSHYRQYHQHHPQQHQDAAVVAANTFHWFKEAARCFDCSATQTSSSSAIRNRPNANGLLGSSVPAACSRIWPPSTYREQLSAPSSIVTSAFGPYAG